MSSSLESPSAPFKKVIEYSYTFKHAITRVWVIVRDAPATALLLPEQHFPIIITKGKETWSVGTEFYGKVADSGEYNGKCIKVKNFPQLKQLIWEIEPKISVTPFHYEYQLFKVDDEKEESTVLLLKLKFYDKKSYDYFTSIRERYEKIKDGLVEKINKLLSQSNLNLYQYEGGLVYSSMEKVWGFLTDFSQLKKIAPLIRMDCDDPDNIYSKIPGEEKKIYIENHKGYYLAKTLKYDQRKNWNKWIFCYQIYSGSIKIPTQIICMALSKVNANECQIAVFTDFKEPATSDYIKSLSIQKKYVIQSIKDYLENYN